MEDSSEYPNYLAGSDLEDEEARTEEFEERIEELEKQIEELKRKADDSRSAGIGVYGLGTIIAVVLSWSKNASILWCILHGILSWIYVIYFAFTR